MKKRYSIKYWLVIALALIWTTSTYADDKTYYTQHTFYTYKNRYDSTNYHVDTLIPINTAVKVTDMGSSSMEFQIPGMNNTEVKFKNIPKYSKLEDMEKVKARLLGTSKVTLSKYSKKVQEAIKNGQVELGMTKEEVLLAYGYPPAHKTPDLKSDQWTFWKNRWARRIVYFKNDKVTEIKG